MHSLSLANVLLAGGDGLGSATSDSLVGNKQSLVLLLLLLSLL
jgi:hypothetical protein